VIDEEAHPPGSWSNPIPLSPGAHRVGARLEGYAPGEERINVVSGDRKEVTLRLTADRGRVAIRATEPNTAIVIDQKPASSGQWEGYLAPGAHVVQFFKDGKLGRETQILVVAGKPIELDERDINDPSRPAGTDKGPPRAPEEPPPRGWYGVITPLMFFPVDNPNESAELQQVNFTFDQNAIGAGVGLRVGYRVSKPIGIEGMFEYRSFKGSRRAEGGAEARDEGFAFNGVRIGPCLRLMTPGWVRFVATVGAGMGIDTANTQTKPGVYVNADEGAEFDFGGVLLGFVTQQMIGSQAVPGSARIHFGAALRIGYGAW
jgi:hypothetical protein